MNAIQIAARSSTAQVPVVLLQPPGTCTMFTRSKSIYPPLGLCQLASTVAPQCVRVIDADGERWSDDETLARVLAHRPVAVGLTATSYTLEIVESWAAKFVAAGVRVIVGGPHASLAPDDLLARCPSVEALVRGEAEPVFPDIVQRIQAGARFDGLMGVATRGNPTASVQILRVPDFGVLPFPRFDGLPVTAYWCPDARRRPMVTMMTTRGCPHSCAFCSSPQLLGRKVRGPEVAAALDELERLQRDHGVKEVSFVDDVFTIKADRTLALCRGIRERGIDLSWFCNARADQISDTLAEAMAAAGCHQVYLGFESGSQEMLDRIHKRATVEQLEAGAAKLALHGIDRSVGFVIGLPGESDETVAASIELALRVRPERIQYTRFTPLVGSPLAAATVPGKGFHGRDTDEVQAWIDRCYAAVPPQGWGRESW